MLSRAASRDLDGDAGLLRCAVRQVGEITARAYSRANSVRRQDPVTASQSGLPRRLPPANALRITRLQIPVGHRPGAVILAIRRLVFLSL